MLIVTCTQDWGDCEPHTVLGQSAVLVREYFRNGEHHMRLSIDGQEFESPSCFWSRPVTDMTDQEQVAMLDSVIAEIDHAQAIIRRDSCSYCQGRGHVGDDPAGPRCSLCH